MTNNLGGPRTGMARVRSLVVVEEGKYVFRFRDERELGVMPWADLIDMVERQGGSRPTFDLFDVPQADGTILRYRAMHDGPVTR